MNRTKQRGFTIIEVSLFVAISGVLAVLLLMGWTVTVNTERYKDSATSLQTFLQQQYNLVYNVENDRTQRWECTVPASGQVNVQSVDLEGADRGTTDCLLMGRYIRVDTTANATVLTVSAIVGAEPTGTPNLSTPEQRMTAYQLATVSGQQIGLTDARLEVPWGARVVQDDGSNRDYAIAIIRWPSTGMVNTYVRAGAESLAEVLADGQNPAISTQPGASMCLDPGTSFAGERLRVAIREKAASQNAITTETGRTGC